MQIFEKNILKLYDKEGEKWLKALPNITARLAKKYGLRDLVPVSNMSFNYVVAGYKKSTPIILKLGLNSKAIKKEADCLKVFAKYSVPKLLISNKNMILMERAVPGTRLTEYFPDREISAIKILCSTIKKLHSVLIPRRHHFYSIEDLLKTLDKDLYIPKNVLARARKLRDKLLQTTVKYVLLHGDLHHDNILKNGDDWLVIDPKGFIGDPAFEPAAFICNPMPDLLAETSCRQIVNERIKRCAGWLKMPEQRVRDWTYVKTVLCWAWSVEDNLNPIYFREFIKIL